MSEDIDSTAPEHADGNSEHTGKVSPATGNSPSDSDLRDPITHLEQAVSELSSRIEDLTRELTDFRKQFQ